MQFSKTNIQYYDLYIFIVLVLILIAPFLFVEIKLLFILLWIFFRYLSPSFKLTSIRIVALSIFFVLAIHGLLFVIWGMLSGATANSLIYTIPLYILFPLLFGSISLVITEKDLHRLFNILLIATPFISLYLVIYFLSHIGVIPFNIPSFYVESHISMIDGAAGIHHNSVSSLLFLAPLYTSFGLLKKYNRKIYWIFYLIGFILLISAIITSNRRSIMVIVCFSVMAIIVFSANSIRAGVLVRTLSFRLFIAVIVLMLSIGTYTAITGVNPYIYVNKVVSSIKGGIGALESDEVRVSQKRALMSSFYEDIWFGKGYGVPATIIRDEDKPWRYEMSFYANLHRLGLVGFLIYFILLLSIYILPLIKGKKYPSSVAEVCMYSASAAQLVGYMVNPTLDAFDSYWQLVIPIWIYAVGLRVGID